MPGDSKDHRQVLVKIFREQVLSEGIIHDGDSVGADDETLL